MAIKRLGARLAIVKSIAERKQSKGVAMAEVPTGEAGHDTNYPAHARNYEGFLTLLKWSIIATVIITAIVLYTISN